LLEGYDNKDLCQKGTTTRVPTIMLEGYDSKKSRKSPRGYVNKKKRAEGYENKGPIDPAVPAGNRTKKMFKPKPLVFMISKP